MEEISPVYELERKEISRVMYGSEPFSYGSLPPSFKKLLRRFIPQAVNAKDNFGHAGYFLLELSG